MRYVVGLKYNTTIWGSPAGIVNAAAKKGPMRSIFWMAFFRNWHWNRLCPNPSKIRKVLWVINYRNIWSWFDFGERWFEIFEDLQELSMLLQPRIRFFSWDQENGKHNIIWCLFGGCRLVDTCQILIPTVEINPTYKKGNANLKLVRWHDSIQLMFNVECSDSIVVGSRSLRYESNHVIILISGLNCLFYFLCVGLISTVGIKIWPQVYRRQQQKRHQIILCFPFSWSQLKKRTCSGSSSGSKLPKWQWEYVPCTLRLTARWKWLCIRMWLGAVRILSRVVFYWGLLWINHVVQHFQLMLDVFAMHCIGDSDSVQHRNWEGRW